MRWILDINTTSVDDNLKKNQNDKTNIINYLKLIFVSILIFINFPLIFCDIYYAVNDNTCINQKIDKLSVNMYDYLIVSGLYSLIISIISIIFIVFFIDKMKNTKTATLNYSFFMLFLYITGLFNIIWNIIGSIIFWNYMDNNLCSNQVSNYLFTSLIIKLIFSSTILLNKNK